MLKKGILRSVENPAIVARANPYCGDPTEWFNAAPFKKQPLFCLNVDFFVDWKNEAIAPVFWTKRIISGTFSPLPDDIYQQIVAADGEDYVHHLAGVARRYGIDMTYLLFRDLPANQWANPKNKIYVFNLSAYERQTDRTSCVQELSADELKNVIRGIRKETHRIGKKSLKYASSTLEVYLAQDDAIYPGDADILLVNQDDCVEAIIEVKKHNQWSQKRAPHIQDETIALYRDIDRLKYQSLGLLKDFLSCPLYMLYYTTITREETAPNALKFEQLVGPHDCLKAVYPKLMPLPQAQNDQSLSDFYTAFEAYRRQECLYDFDHICLTDSYHKGRPISRANPKCLQYIADPRCKAAEKAAVQQYLSFLAP